MVCGKFVERFSEASHALPIEMHMNADYPFMIPEIVAYDGKIVTIRGSFGQTASFVARRGRGWGMYGILKQSSSFEIIFNWPPTRFEMRPFKDDRTPSIAERQTSNQA